MHRALKLLNNIGLSVEYITLFFPIEMHCSENLTLHISIHAYSDFSSGLKCNASHHSTYAGTDICRYGCRIRKCASPLPSVLNPLSRKTRRDIITIRDASHPQHHALAASRRPLSRISKALKWTKSVGLKSDARERRSWVHKHTQGRIFVQKGRSDAIAVSHLSRVTKSYDERHKRTQHHGQATIRRRNGWILNQ